MLFISINLALVICLVYVLIQTDKPLLCASLYALVWGLISLSLGQSCWASLATGFFAFCGSGFYFWLLDRLNSSILWWFVVAGGALLGFGQFFTDINTVKIPFQHILI